MDPDALDSDGFSLSQFGFADMGIARGDFKTFLEASETPDKTGSSDCGGNID